MERLAQMSIIFIGLSLLVLVLKAFQTFLRPFTVAVVLTLLVMPWIRNSTKKGIPTSVSMIGMLLIFAFVLFVIGLLFSSQNINQELSGTEQNIRNSIGELNQFVSKISGKELQVNQMIKPGNVNNLLGSAFSTGIQAVSSIFSELFLVILFMLFLIPSHDMTLKSIRKNLSEKDRKKFKTTMHAIEKSIKDYLVTKTLVSLGTALATAIVLFALGSDFVFVLAFLFFILNYIPNLGSLIAIVLAMLAYFLKFGFVLNLVWLLVCLVFIQILFGNILEPKFTGKKLNLSPIVILLSLFFWYWVWGVVGMMLAIPLVSILKILLENVEFTKHTARFLE